MGRTLISTPRQASMTTTTQGLRSAHHGMLICSLIVGVSFPGRYTSNPRGLHD
jgi:hypothetical protein